MISQYRESNIREARELVNSILRVEGLTEPEAKLAFALKVLAGNHEEACMAVKCLDEMLYEIDTLNKEKDRLLEDLKAVRQERDDCRKRRVLTYDKTSSLLSLP